MNDALKVAKRELKDVQRPYLIYWYYLILPMAFIIFMILALLGIKIEGVSTAFLILVIVANIGASKLKLLSKKKYVAPILFYIVNVLTIVFLPIGDSYYIAMGLFVFPIEIISIIFFFISAKNIKTAYPTMKQDYQNARNKYLDVIQKK